MKKILILIPMLIIAASCGKTPAAEGKDTEFTPITLTKAQQNINSGSNTFGLELYHRLNKGDQMLISPLSASLALSMTAYGANGLTAEQMMTTLGFDGLGKEEVAGYYQTMVNALKNADGRTTLEIANSIWAKDGISVKEDFKDGVRKYFDSEIREITGGASAEKEINKWCSEKTHGMIPKIVDKLKSEIVMVLMNALYFKGFWNEPFTKTYTGKFTAIDSGKTDVKMMEKKQSMNYSETKEYKMVSVPYGNGAFVMDIILPADDKTDFLTAANGLDWGKYSQLIDRQDIVSVFLKMPVFKADYSAKMNDVLIAMGMTEAFKSSADFSGISDSGLMIDEVIQKTAIDVNEKGTEAAAVTIVTMKLTSAGPLPEEIEFIADRPFIYSIRETSTNALLFIGQKVR